MRNNDTQQHMNIPNPNLQLNNNNPAQPVPVAYQAPVQPIVIQTGQAAPQPNVVVVEENKDSHAIIVVIVKLLEKVLVVV